MMKEVASSERKEEKVVVREAEDVLGTGRVVDEEKTSIVTKDKKLVVDVPG